MHGREQCPIVAILGHKRAPSSAYLGPDVHHDAWCCGDLPGGKVLDRSQTGYR